MHLSSLSFTLQHPKEKEAEMEDGKGKKTLGNFGREEEVEDAETDSDENRNKGLVLAGKKFSSSARYCQADNCRANLRDEKSYHKRHRVCEQHAKAGAVVVVGILQRFCQQCSRFHEVSEFDNIKRSCRRRLAGHNQRRRKSSAAGLQGDDKPYSSNSCSLSSVTP